MIARIGSCLILLSVGFIAPVSAQPDDDTQKPIEKRVYTTARIVGEAPVLDGRLDDPAWDTVEWSGDFIQRDPTDGDPPSQQTRFKVLYDDSAIYFAFRLYDDPELLTRMLARRDWFPGDWIEVNIDSYFDHRTGFSFTLSLSGTRGDEFISNDGENWSSSWDPVWSGATQTDAEGWTAEMRIPLSQLRFSRAEEQRWGLQVQRRIFRLEERSSWQRIPKDSSGWVSQFGELRGLRDLKPKRNVELLPYAVASAERFEAEPGNPFRDGRDSEFDAGLDGKIGVTNNLTFDFTINPDFGQVEADPSQVNLTEFETFFRERRPFFIEGNNILDLRLAPAITGGSFTRDNLFYSRRIGRRPSVDVDAPEGAHVDVPDSTTIIGAVKLTGKTAGGLTVGVLESVTLKERAEIDDGGVRSHATVEPLTNYFVGRLQQDFHGGDTQFGGMVTAVNRDIDDPQLDILRDEAYSGGLDFSTYFRDRDYRLQANVFASEIRGSTDSISAAQRSSARYYQRPDNDYVTLDDTRTSLSGHAGSVRFSRTSNHDLMFQTGVAWRSPGFEINDLGFMRNADRINQFTWVGYAKRDPFSIFDNWQINANQWLDWDFGGNFLAADFNVNSNARFHNKYGAGFNVNRAEEQTSNTMLRGGPSSIWPGGWNGNIWAESDHRKDFIVNLGVWASRRDDDSGDGREVWLNLTFRPTNAIRLSLNSAYSRNRPEMQYIATGSFGVEEEARYLFGRLNQKTIALTFRMDYSITPDLTVQYYGAPFLSSGRYTEFKRITDPRADAYRDRFSLFTDAQTVYEPVDDRFDFDEDLNGLTDYGFSNPDFDVREFNSNLVVRWEYRPGSIFYFVWSQARRDYSPRGDHLDFHDDLDQLFAAHPHDIVLIKVSKWFNP
jgi:hypothetical protein